MGDLFGDAFGWLQDGYDSLFGSGTQFADQAYSSPGLVTGLVNQYAPSWDTIKSGAGMVVGAASATMKGMGGGSASNPYGSNSRFYERQLPGSSTNNIKTLPDAGKNKAVQSENPHAIYSQWMGMMSQFAYGNK